jgi:hypothetical protein
VDFGGSHLAQQSDVPGGEFTFDYIIYQKPEKYTGIPLRERPEFVQFLSELLISIIADRKQDRQAKQKLDAVAGAFDRYICSIKIDERFYPNYGSATVI